MNRISEGGPRSAAWRTTVRVGDCDQYGHVNNTVYTDYLVSATLAAWSDLFPGTAWSMRRIRIDFRSPLTHGEEIETILWPAGNPEGLPGCVECGYRIVRLRDGEVASEALVSWLLDRHEGEDPSTAAGTNGRDPAGEPLEGAWPTDTSNDTPRFRPASHEPNRPDAHIYRHTVLTQPYEADHTGLINPMWIFRWTWASMLLSCAEAGWPLDGWREAGLMVYQSSRDAELFSELRPWETVEVESRLYDLRRVRGTWEHRVLRDGEVIAIDRATGVFLDLDGGIAPPRSGIMESIVVGHD